nr:MAG TPA: hypothetical protein [Caudoviricetes sp.]
MYLSGIISLLQYIIAEQLHENKCKNSKIAH